EVVGELPELVLAAFEVDPVGEGSARGHACRIGDASQGGEHAAAEKPSSQKAEYQQERHHDGCDRGEVAQQSAVALDEEDHTRVHSTRKGEVHGYEQQGTGEHEEAGVAEGELDANAQP